MARSAIRRLLDRPNTLPAAGVIEPGRGLKRIVVACEPAMFDRVNCLAAASGVSFAEAVRQLLDRGLNASVDRPQYERAMRTLTAPIRPLHDGGGD